MKGLVAATVAGAGVWLAFRMMPKPAEAQTPRVIYVSEPVPQPTSGGSSGANPLAALLNIGLSILDGAGGDPVFQGRTSGTFAPSIPTTTVPTARQDGPLIGGGGLAALFDVIGAAEAPGGYDTVSGFTKIQPPRPLTTMTVREVQEWQRRNIRAGARSTAAGRYQIISGTLNDLVSAGVLSLGERFSSAAQDRAATWLAERRGLSAYRQGRLSAEAFANSLAREWAGLPVATGSNAGRSHYDGDGLNSATVSVSRVLDAIRRI